MGGTRHQSLGFAPLTAKRVWLAPGPQCGLVLVVAEEGDHRGGVVGEGRRDEVVGLEQGDGAAGVEADWMVEVGDRLRGHAAEAVAERRNAQRSRGDARRYPTLRGAAG